MAREICVYGPTVMPIIEQHGRGYLVDLTLARFRGLTSPYEALSFGSDSGRELAAAAGIRTCSICGTSFIAAGVRIGMRCVRCGDLIEKDLGALAEVRDEDGQERAIVVVEE